MIAEEIWEESNVVLKEETGRALKGTFRKRGLNAICVIGIIIAILSVGWAVYAHATANRRVEGNPLVIPIVGLVVGLSIIGFGLSSISSKYDIRFTSHQQKLDIQIKSASGVKSIEGVTDFRFITRLYEDSPRVEIRFVVNHNDKCYAFTELVDSPEYSPFPVSYEYMVFDDEFLPLEKGFLVLLAAKLDIA